VDYSGVGKGHHLRRIHYQLVSAASPIAMVNGKPYENTDGCWQALCAAAADARHLGLVPIDALVDRRNDEPVIHLPGSDTRATVFVAGREPGVYLDLEMPRLPGLFLTNPVINQRYHVELWCEKTTVNDILVRLARQFGLNVVTGAGELSITACVDVVNRARSSGRPVRIIYISDFDPAGQSMPLAVARKIEHRLYYANLRHLDIQVRPVVLTAEQCRQYNLPRTPIKDTERRGSAFEKRFGKGATELDALEALHPGTLAKILTAEIERYYDYNLSSRVYRAGEEFRSRLEEVNDAVLERHRDAIADVEHEWQHIIELIGAWQDRAKPLWQAVTADLQAEAPDPGSIEWPEPVEGDDDPDPLFDSRRASYVEQIDRYKRHQGKPIERRRRAGLKKGT
jgi:hypothetical protein